MYQTQTFEISIVTLSFLRLFVLQCIKYEFSRQNQSAFVCQKVRDIQTFEILTMKRSKTCWHTLYQKIEIVLYLVRKLSSKCFLGAFTSFSGDKDLLLRVFSFLQDYSLCCCSYCHWLSWHPTKKYFSCSSPKNEVESCHATFFPLSSTDGQRHFIKRLANL